MQMAKLLLVDLPPVVLVSPSPSSPLIRCQHRPIRRGKHGCYERLQRWHMIRGCLLICSSPTERIIKKDTACSYGTLADLYSPLVPEREKTSCFRTNPTVSLSSSSAHDVVYL